MNKYFWHTLACLIFFLFSSSSIGFTQENSSISPSKLQVVNATLDAFDTTQPAEPVVAEPQEPSQHSYLKDDSSKKISKNVKISGEIRSSVGIYSDRLVFNRANGNLTERNYALLSHDQLFRGENTFDPAIYSRLKMVMDATVAPAVSMHLNITIDPWSFTGKSKELTVTGNSGDTAKVQYLFWGNTGYTVNQIVKTLQKGDAFAIPELKVHNNIVPATRATSAFSNVFNIPETSIDYTFQPIREAWIDFKPEDNAVLRIFALAYQDQALSTDDPLKLSGNMEWWAENPWINDWTPGHFNSGVGDFYRGLWDRGLSYYARDSDLQRLTALRGISLKVHPDNDNSFEAVVASPKTLWQEYGEINAIPASMRIKHFVNDSAYMGALTNAHWGFNEGSLDAENYTTGIDGGIMAFPWLMVNGEYSISSSHYDETSPDFETKKHGNAYYISFVSSSNPEGMIRKDYFGLHPIEQTDDFFKTKLFFSRMDADFESTLSQYHETRSDSFWSRSLTFYPNTYRFLPGVEPNISEDDVGPFAIGNGIDYGRSVVGWRVDNHWMEGKLKGLTDIRHVWSNDSREDLIGGKRYIETVARTQWALQATDKLLTRALLLWHGVPKTTQNVDPFITDGAGDHLLNTAVTGGKDPSLKTAALGARYELTPWANINGVWMHTNDFTVASNNFPQGILNDSSFAVTNENGRNYRSDLPFLYDQGYFRQAPYQYHNIFKTGLELIPAEVWHIYLDYTVNPNKFAGNIDDNMNHFGLETSYVPNKRIGFFARYTYSRWYDIDQLVFDNELKYKGYNNLFFETRMLLSLDSTLSIQYGVGPSYNTKTRYEDPNLNYYLNPTLSTQHLVRLTYEKKF